ncbi:MAG: hypothetical protein JKY21_03210 [Alcanivorax sp.]|nr:hypothetical protein [Alcanivorax sp.]
MRIFFAIALLALAASGHADKVLLLESPPTGCDAKDTVSIETGSKWQGLLFSDAWIESNAKKKLLKAIRKADGNRAVLKDRREFLMDNHHRGIQRIELEAWTWRCEEQLKIDNE